MDTPITNIFMDMDGTVCESRQIISDEMRDFLNGLNKNIFVISGASREQMEKQLKGLNCTILAQSGNDTPRWKHKLNFQEKIEIHTHIAKIMMHYNQYFNKPHREMVEDRGCQITLSLVGHNADIELKKIFDPDKRRRKRILHKIPFESSGLTATIAGTTCIDYTRVGGDKGGNLKKWIKDLDVDTCIYFGDNLQYGGNDYSVVGVMKTIPVTTSSLKKTLLALLNLENA